MHGQVLWVRTPIPLEVPNDGGMTKIMGKKMTEPEKQNVMRKKREKANIEYLHFLWTVLYRSRKKKLQNRPKTNSLDWIALNIAQHLQNFNEAFNFDVEAGNKFAVTNYLCLLLLSQSDWKEMEYKMCRFEQLSNGIFKRKLMGTLPVSPHQRLRW